MHVHAGCWKACLFTHTSYPVELAQELVQRVAKASDVSMCSKRRMPKHTAKIQATTTRTAMAKPRSHGIRHCSITAPSISALAATTHRQHQPPTHSEGSRRYRAAPLLLSCARTIIRALLALVFVLEGRGDFRWRNGLTSIADDGMMADSDFHFLFLSFITKVYEVSEIGFPRY